MIREKYAILKSGTDIRGTAVSGKSEITLTDKVVKGIARAFGVFVKCKSGRANIRVAVGHDSRISSDDLNRLVSEALALEGVDVCQIGLCSTPSMFMITKDESLNVDASIMLTASHHPMDKNGMKFFTAEGGVESSDIDEILTIASSKSFDTCEPGKIEFVDYMPTYCDILVNKARTATGKEKPLEGFKIVVDAGNGAGGFYATKVLQPLGCDTTGSQFLEPDGTFPNHIPNPENKVAMDSISSCVLKNKADLGVIFDTDVDRAAAVGSDGLEINRNKLIALISAILLSEQTPATIVTDSITSVGLRNFIESLGGVQRRFKRGYKNVINESIRLNSLGEYSPLAIETSGHAALAENFFLDDGAYLVTRIIIEMAKLKEQGRNLTDLIDTLHEGVEELEIRMGFNNQNFKDYGLTILEEYKMHVESSCDGITLEEPNYEGVRVNFDKDNGDGWLLLRMSVHDPIMPLNIESSSVGGCSVIANHFYNFITTHKGVNFENLTTYINKVI